MSKAQKKKRDKVVRTDLSIYFDDHCGQIHVNNLDFIHRVIYISAEPDLPRQDSDDEPGVEFFMSARLIKNLDILNNLSRAPILIKMKTNGGLWTEGMAMYDAIRFSPSPVVILSYTHARSMSSMILQAGDRRVLMPHSYFMLHWGIEAYDDTVRGVKAEFKWNRKLDSVMLDLYGQRMKEKGLFKNKPRKIINQWLDERMKETQEVYLSPKETVRLGLADGIFDGDWTALMKGVRKR